MQLFVLAKTIQEAKTRLAGVLAPGERAALAEAMLADVLLAAALTPELDRVTVLSSGRCVEDIARRHGAALMIQTGAGGLNDAARQALDQARSMGDEPVIILPADLPWIRADDISALLQAWRPGMVIASPSIDGGTNALALDTGLRWRFRYGPDSFAAHAAVARAEAIRFQPVRRENLACDLDDVEMLRRMMTAANHSRPGPHTRAVLDSLRNTTLGRRYA